MATIESCFAPNEPVFETDIVITKTELLKYCDLYKLNLKDFKLEEEKFWIPGHYVIGTLRAMMPILHEKYPDFPLKKIISFYGGPSNGTHENRIIIQEEVKTIVIVKMQLRVLRDTPKEKFCLLNIEFYEKNRIFMSGLFTLVERQKQK